MVEKIKQKSKPLIFTKPSLTQQHFKDATDINKIYDSYCKRNIPLPVKNTVPRYGEITATSLLAAKELIDSVNDEFYSLSPDIRSKFDNDPVKLVEFVGKSDNLQAAIELGLLPKPNASKNDVDVNCLDSSAKSEPLPDHLSLTGKGDTIISENVTQTTVNTES